MSEDKDKVRQYIEEYRKEIARDMAAIEQSMAFIGEAMDRAAHAAEFLALLVAKVNEADDDE